MMSKLGDMAEGKNRGDLSQRKSSTAYHGYSNKVGGRNRKRQSMMSQQHIKGLSLMDKGGNANEDDFNDSDETDSDSGSSFWSKISGAEDVDESVILNEQTQAIMALGWFDKNILTADNFNRFNDQFSKNFDPEPFKELMSIIGLKKLWAAFRSGNTIYQVSKNRLLRHRSQLEIQIHAKIAQTNHVLMEHLDGNYLYIHYLNPSVYLDDEWDTNFEVSLNQLFQFSVMWQRENLTIVEHEACLETKKENDSNTFEYVTKDHLNLIIAEILDPSAPSVTRAQIGLPVGEQFIRNGKRYKWVKESEAMGYIKGAQK